MATCWVSFNFSRSSDLRCSLFFSASSAILRSASSLCNSSFNFAFSRPMAICWPITISSSTFALSKVRDCIAARFIAPTIPERPIRGITTDDCIASFSKKGLRGPVYSDTSAMITGLPEFAALQANPSPGFNRPTA